MAIRVGINGFGRIGRLVYRIGLDYPDFEVVAVNDLVPADNLAYLLKYDTMHGRLRVNGRPGDVAATENSFTVAGRTTRTFAEKDPARLPWKDLGVSTSSRAPGFSPSSRRPIFTSPAAAPGVSSSRLPPSPPSRSPRSASV
jgi:glyceraldehyde 3-phosphate dehydrogenase